MLLLLQTRREFKSVVSFDLDIQSILDTWSDCCCRLISLSKLEYSTRSVLKKILDQLEDCETGDGKDSSHFNH